ncbi:MAG: HAMP domain-containing protein [Pirellulales bacterium]|nr:HAMP domain-containing protein [Pirellulales bacterium]
MDTVSDVPPQLEEQEWSFAQRHGLLLVGVSPIIPNAIGSTFNILYNHTQIEPILSPVQLQQFHNCVMVFNVAVYPLAIACFIAPLLWLRPTHRALLRGEPVDPERLVKSRRYAVNLPWWFLTISAVGWLLCIPVFPAALRAVPEPLTMNVVWHLVVSFLTASLIAVTQSFFAVELTIQKVLFPVFFRRENPASVPGAVPMSIGLRGMLWAFSAVVSPVVSLVMLILVPDEDPSHWFAVSVGVVAIFYGLISMWMLGQLVAAPARQLRRAAMRVAENDLDVRVNLLRADEFGPLIEQFNLMVKGMREREHLQETFGRHVGQEAAQRILEQGDTLVGNEQTITVMFADVRNFTTYSSTHTPAEVVSALNVFFREAVEKVELHGGMVNKFLGDGFMALFGIGAQDANHALQAVQAGQAMLCCLEESAQQFADAGWAGLKIGIGINTGPAIVGSIGSPKRQEYTAIGDTVNVAARVEALTKTVGCDLVVTESTHKLLPADIPLKSLSPQPVKGKGEPLQVYAIVHN